MYICIYIEVRARRQVQSSTACRAARFVRCQPSIYQIAPLQPASNSSFRLSIARTTRGISRKPVTCPSLSLSFSCYTRHARTEAQPTVPRADLSCNLRLPAINAASLSPFFLFLFSLFFFFFSPFFSYQREQQFFIPRFLLQFFCKDMKS